MSILSIQSHVAFGYVGNKAAVFPLQSMGIDVWPINTVQFSNHTGYGKCQGKIFTGEHILAVAQGIEDLGVVNQCQAILSGYMGNSEICHAVATIVKKFKTLNPNLLYLCDPVIGNKNCYVKPEVLDFFKTELHADIITPNQFEAETLCGITIKTVADLKKVAKYFHSLGIKIVVITGIKMQEFGDDLAVFVSDQKIFYAIKTKEYSFAIAPNGTGDILSALFLGNYLKTKDVILSLKRTIYFMDLVMQNTFKSKSRELQILNINYAEDKILNLPNGIEV